MKVRLSLIALVVVLAGCSASHTASPTSVLPGTPSLTSQDVEPFNLYTKNIVYKYPLPNPDSAPFHMATGSDKKVWFTEQGVARIGRITQNGVITEYAIPSGSSGIDIAPRASGTLAGGTLWFTEISKIGKISTSTGHVTELPLPSGDFADGGIAMGPDGDMWFTDHHSNSIGRITPTGTVTEYLLPTAGADPLDIVAGPDGNLWFVGGSFEVGKITTAGVITEYPGGQYFQQAIAAGPDGNLYASTLYGVERITTQGVITSYTSPTTIVWGDIVLGPDKQMWLTNMDPNRPFIQEFNPTTQTFSTGIQLSSIRLGGLTVGGDGDVWIADYNGNSIFVYEENVTTIGIRLNGELSFTDPNYGLELGYAVGVKSTQTQTISLRMGESVQFKNVDTEPHSAAFLGNATSNSAPWPGSFNGSTTQSPAGTAIGTAGWATGSLNRNKTSPIYETGLPGFYMIGCQYHYNTNQMRTVVVVH